MQICDNPLQKKKKTIDHEKCVAEINLRIMVTNFS